MDRTSVSPPRLAQRHKLNRDKLAARFRRAARTLSAKTAIGPLGAANTGSSRNLEAGEPAFPDTRLTETVEVTDLGGAGQAWRVRLGDACDRDAPAVPRRTKNPGPKLNLADEISRDEEGEQKGRHGRSMRLAKEFKAQRGDADQGGLEIARFSRPFSGSDYQATLSMQTPFDMAVP